MRSLKQNINFHLQYGTYSVHYHPPEWPGSIDGPYGIQPQVICKQSNIVYTKYKVFYNALLITLTLGNILETFRKIADGYPRRLQFSSNISTLLMPFTQNSAQMLTSGLTVCTNVYVLGLQGKTPYYMVVLAINSFHNPYCEGEPQQQQYSIFIFTLLY